MCDQPEQITDSRSCLDLPSGWWVAADTEEARRAALGEAIEGVPCITLRDARLNGPYGRRKLGDREVPTPFVTYARQFNIPAAWQTQRIVLELDYARYNVTAWLNGEEVAHYVGGLEPHRLDVTDSLRPGKANLLVIRVGDSGTSGHRQFDCHDYTGTRLPTCDEIVDNLVHPVNYGGADRGVGFVTLHALPAVRVDHVFADPKVAAGELHYAVALVNDTDTARTVQLRSEAVDARQLIDEPVNLPPQQTVVISRTIAWPDAILWDLDTPHLYRLKTTLTDADDETLDVHTDTFGFREFTINGHSFFLNGRKIHLFT